MHTSKAVSEFRKHSLNRAIVSTCTVQWMKLKHVLHSPTTSSILVAFVILALSLFTARSRLASLLSHWSPSRSFAIQSHLASMAYEKELKVAQLAVQRAAILTKAVFHEKAKGTVSKDVSHQSRVSKTTTGRLKIRRARF